MRTKLAMLGDVNVGDSGSGIDATWEDIFFGGSAPNGTPTDWSTPVGTTYYGSDYGNTVPNQNVSSTATWSTTLSNVLGAVSGALRGSPQLPAGAVLVQGTNGQTYIRYPSGQQTLYQASGSVSGNLGAWAIAAVGLFVVIGMAKK